MKTKYFFTLLSLAAMGLGSCSDERMDSLSDSNGDYPVKLAATIDQINVTRADDSGFADGDRIGIYMVDFVNGQPSPLLPGGNHADNHTFTYDEKTGLWESPTPLFFMDRETPADLYGYYPYINNVDDAGAIPFSVQRNQSAEASSTALSGYESSDLLWAKFDGASAAISVVNLTFSHILAGIEVNLVEGEGFDPGEWADLEKSVMVDGTVRDGVFNLAGGNVEVDGSGDGRAIIANHTGRGFRAVVLPQTVNAGSNLITVNVGSDSYCFQKDVPMEYRSGRLHKFTFEVSKKYPGGTFMFELIGEGVTVWESDPMSHDGLSRAYQVVELNKGERLEEVLKSMEINPKDVINLKIKGFVYNRDFFYIRDNMRKIQALNLKEARIWGEEDYDEDMIPDIAMTNRVTLKYLVLPDRLKQIGRYAFAGTILEGSLKIPEGVTHIGDQAFLNYWNENGAYSEIPDGGQLLANSNLTGTLELPSSVVYIGDEAFRGCDFTGQLRLPSSLEYLGGNAFSGCRNLSGQIRLPENLTYIGSRSDRSGELGEGVFYGTGIQGVVELPGSLKVIAGMGGMDVTSILIPDGATEIAPMAFYLTKVKSGIVIPESVIEIGREAFSRSNITHISLPEGITTIRERTFSDCPNLCDTMRIPENVEVIEEEAFAGCERIEALELPAKLRHISHYAFSRCYSINYIHCEAKEPPGLSEDAFAGIEKDNFTVEVPEESVDAYRNAPGWREFKRIAAYRNFVARPSKYNVLNKGGKREITLNADEAWEVSECPSWCHVDKTSGIKKTVLTLTVDELAKGSSHRSGKVEFRLKGDKEYTTHINVGQYDYEYDEDSYVELQKATKGKGIDIFLLGDGYDAADISSGLLMQDMEQTMEYFFGVEPYTTYREYFNVYTGIPLSEDSGVEELDRWRNTKFHTVMPYTSGLRISTDWMKAFDYCAEICDPILSKPDPQVGIILLANIDACDGVTFVVGDSFCALVTKSTCPYPSDARGLVQHEAGGHGIGWLGDEYIYHSDRIDRCQCGDCRHVAGLLSDQSWGFARNLSLNGKYKEVPWAHLIFNPAYTDIVDVYEGGYFHGHGVYRSENNSCMNNNVPYFSTWSRQLIVERIMKLAGEEFSLEKFYANDSREMGRVFTTTRGYGSTVTESGYGNPPIIMKDFKFGKKGGRK